MTAPSKNSVIRALVGKLGNTVPTEPEAASLLGYVIQQLANGFSELRPWVPAIQSGVCLASIHPCAFLGDYLESDPFVAAHRKENPTEALFDVALGTGDGGAYHLVFGLPGSTNDQVTVVHLEDDFLKLATLFIGVNEFSARMTEKLDIRQLLGSFGCLRQGIVIGGSPGWDISAVKETVSKNAGNLVATWNDCNVFFQQLLALSPDDRIYGASCSSIVQTRYGFLGLLDYIFRDKWKRKQWHLNRLPDRTQHSQISSDGEDHLINDLQVKGKLSGLIGTDFFLTGGGVSSGGLCEIFSGGGIGKLNAPKTVDRDRLVPLRPERFACFDEIGQLDNYVLIYYSGHGSISGDIQIERNESITAEELAEFSKERGVIFALFLDMCHSSQFAYRFEKHLSKVGWRGLVFAANDVTTFDGGTFESPIMASIRRLAWPVQINSPNWECGRGLYTSALALALLLLRDAELAAKRPLTIDLRSFNDELLRPITSMFAQNYDLPLIRPTLYSFL